MRADPDLTPVVSKLDRIFRKYPAGNLCDVCAMRVGKTLLESGYKVAIVTIRNKEIFTLPGFRAPYIEGKKPDGEPFRLTELGFHQANQITYQDELYYIDSLVFLHYGVQAISQALYFDLFVYGGDVEITEVRALGEVSDG